MKMKNKNNRNNKKMNSKNSKNSSTITITINKAMIKTIKKIMNINIIISS